MYVEVDERDVKMQSSYLKYLPALYRGDDFMGRFLLIFESILEPIERTVNNAHLYFDPSIAPADFVPWLASWTGLTFDPMWTEEKRRELLKSAIELYRWRGTKRGLTEHLRIYLGITPEITEYIEGMKLDSETKLGINTKIGSSGGGNHFTVTLKLDSDSETDISKVRAIIDSHKPAHTTYTLIVKGNMPEK